MQANTTVLPSSNLSICNPLILPTVWLRDKLGQTSFVFPNNQSISCRRQGYRYLATGYDFPGISQPKPKQELVKLQVRSCPLKKKKMMMMMMMMIMRVVVMMMEMMMNMIAMMMMMMMVMMMMMMKIVMMTRVMLMMVMMMMMMTRLMMMLMMLLLLLMMMLRKIMLSK